MSRNENITRFPRPMGLTAMMQEYHKTKDPATLNKAQEYLINTWLMGNGVICGIMYDINTFSQKLGIDINYIRMYMRDRLLNSKIWDKDRQEELIIGLLGEQLSWAMEDRMEVSHQVQVLREAQGGKYTPFISAELNKALKLKLESSTSLQSIVRAMTGGSTTNIFNQFNQQKPCFFFIILCFLLFCLFQDCAQVIYSGTIIPETTVKDRRKPPCPV